MARARARARARASLELEISKLGGSGNPKFFCTVKIFFNNKKLFNFRLVGLSEKVVRMLEKCRD